MAPIEDLHSRDLAWISEFVMQQMVIMMRPLLDHLQNTDGTVEYMQHAVQRLSMDMSDVRGDLERTNKYLGILRQGLGVHNESKCMLQRGIDSSARTAKRLDDQMDSMFVVIRGMEDSISQNCTEVRGVGAKHEELSRLMAEGSSNMEDLQAKVERVCNDAHSMKDDVKNNEARLEVWQRELRELRRGQLGMAQAPSLEDKLRQAPSSRGCGASVSDSWPQKKTQRGLCVGLVDSTPTDMGGGNPATASTSGTGANISDIRSSSKHMGRDRASVQARLQQDLGFLGSSEDSVAATGDEAVPSSSRLPILATSKQIGVSKAGLPTRPAEGSYTTAPRLRFSETSVRAPSCNSRKQRGPSPG